MVITWFENKKSALAGFTLGILAVIAIGTSLPNLAMSRSAAQRASSQQMAFERQQNDMLLSASYAEPPGESPQTDAVRKIANSSGFDLIVSSPENALEKIRLLTENFGGYLVTSQISHTEGSSVSINIRIPVVHAEEAKAEIRKLAVRIDSEKTEAEDVTKQWVDTDAHLRNLRTTEQQYLQILKRATSVDDTVEVTDKLSEIRGQIEQQQTEFVTLSRRVETVAINIDLRADDDVQVLGLHWRPLYRAKLSLREAIDALGDYTATMFGVILHIPLILLWLLTGIAFAAIGWRFLRWAARIFFGWKPQPKV